MFKRIFLVNGSPLERNVLKLARIQNAAKAVIMSDDPILQKDNKSGISHEMLDAQSNFIYKAIKRINPTLDFRFWKFNQKVESLNMNPTL